MIKIAFEMPQLDEQFKAHRKDMMLVLAASMQTNRAMMFDKDGADNGKEVWPDPAFRRGRPLQAKGYLRKSMAPTNDGIKPGHGPDGIVRIGETEATIGTSLMYARMMNDGTTKMPGGVLRAVKAKALKIPIPPGIAKDMAYDQQKKAFKSGDIIPKGKRAKAKAGIIKEGKQNFMFRKWVKIPARPMDTITSEDKQEWADTMANFIGELLNNG